MPEKYYVGEIRKAPKQEKRLPATKEGHERRANQFIIAIMEESRKQGKPMSWAQARRELQAQQRISQKNLLWQEHRETLTETSPKKEARARDLHVTVTKQLGKAPESETEILRRELNAALEEIKSLKESYKIVSTENKQLRRELNR